MPKVSVIVPVYGVEKYIERCARSLFEQTLDDIEYLFIDDCTPDRSIEILQQVLKEYPQRKPQVVIHRMEKNSGQAAVRKWGMQNATGEYVIHCDSDDWVDTDMYRAMYEKAKEEEADVVVCDFTRTDGIRTNRTEIGCHDTNLIEYKKNCLFQRDHWSLCNKLFARACYREITYPETALGEDMMMCVQMLDHCRKLSYINKAFYNYYFNPGSITKKRTVENCSKNYYSLKQNTDFTTEFIKNTYDNNIDIDLASKYLKMVNAFVLLPIKHLSKYNEIWRHELPVMPFRYFINMKCGYYNKVIYILAVLGLYPRKKDRAV